MQAPNVAVLDSLLASVPAAAAASTPTRAQYEGARVTRANVHWRPQVRSANAEIRPDEATLHSRALWLARNEPICDGARQTICDEVIGEDGIASRADIRGADRRPVPGLNVDVNDFVKAWEDECDVQEKRDWTGLTDQNLSDVIVQGNNLLIESYHGSGTVSPLQYELVEPHQLDRSFDNYAWAAPGRSGSGELILNGIKYDRLLRPVAYRVYRNRGDQLGLGFSESEWVPAERVIHLYRSERSQQLWGVTWFRKIIAKIWSTDDYLNSEIDAAANAAKLVALFQNEDADGMGLTIDEDGTVVDKNGNPFEGLAPSTFLVGGPNDKLTVVNGNRPNSSGEAFLKFLLRSMGLGMHLSYYRISGDSSGASYSTLRAENARDDKYFGPVKRWQIWNVNRRVRQRVLAEAFVMGRLSGDVPSPREFLTQRRRFLQAKFISGGTTFIDEDKEVRAAIGRVKGGMSDFEWELAKVGRDWREVFERLAEQRAYAEELGLDVDELFGGGTAARNASKRLPNPGGEKNGRNK